MSREILQASVDFCCNEYSIWYIWCQGSDLVTPRLHTLRSRSDDKISSVSEAAALTGPPYFHGCVWCFVLNKTCELSAWTGSQDSLHHDTKYLHEWFDCAKVSTQIMRQVFVGAGDEWRGELVENDGQKSPAGISYKLHCNLLVLFLLFISRSKLEKGREKLGIFMTFWEESVTNLLIESVF